MDNKFNLTWHTFMTYGRDLFKELMDTHIIDSDVTLVSDDQHQFNVHKFILSACSSVLKNILENNPQNTLIYLRGVHHEELESVLHFLYTGKATFNKERINEFLGVANDLDIKCIKENVETDKVNSWDSFFNEKVMSSKESANIEEIEITNIEDEVPSKNTNFDEEILFKHTNIVEAIALNKSKNEDTVPKDNFDINESLSPINENNGKLVENKSSNKLKRKYRKSKHEGNKYKCQQCDFQAEYYCRLQRHVIKHEGYKYQCQQCDYITSQTTTLRKHVQSDHEGIRYQCQKCDYQATQIGGLRRHEQSSHEGIRYPCQECDYQATRLYSLKKHMQYKHEGIKYPCNYCDHQATMTFSLKKHIQIKHSNLNTQV